VAEADLVEAALGIEAVACVSVQTLLNWKGDVERGVVRRVAARKPLNALPDLVREVAAFLKREWPVWGTRRIAGILARLGLRASRTSVQRIVRHPLPRRPVPDARGRSHPIPARRFGRVFVVDFTVVRSFFRSVVVGAVLDAFTRRVLSIRVFPQEPSAPQACRLVADAVRRHGRPVWLVSDRGTQFTSRRFRAFLARRRIRRRFVGGGTRISRDSTASGAR
jgi:transposase InsO family protein